LQKNKLLQKNQVIVRRPVVARRRTVVRRRRGGKGDVWLQDKNGNWLDVNVVGTFRYFRDSNNKFDVDVQFGSINLGSAITAVAIIARGNVIKGEKNGLVTLNGRLIAEKSAILKFDNDKVEIKKLVTKEPGLFIIEGLRKEQLSFRFFAKVGSYDIKESTTVSHSEGVFSDPTNPKKYVISKKESKFTNYIAFGKNDVSTGNPEQKQEAEKCCGKLIGKDKEMCETDYYRTDVCFADEYTANLPLKK